MNIPISAKVASLVFVLGYLYHGRRAQICDVKVFAVVLEQVCEFGDHGIESVLVIFLIHQLGDFDGHALFEGMASQMTFLSHMLAMYCVAVSGKEECRRRRD